MKLARCNVLLYLPQASKSLVCATDECEMPALFLGIGGQCLLKFPQIDTFIKKGLLQWCQLVSKVHTIRQVNENGLTLLVRE